ncbi:MAG: hypothetical protein B7Y39_17465, partial [Bdellovibrio sp. 28-41-41]
QLSQKTTAKLLSTKSPQLWEGLNKKNHFHRYSTEEQCTLNAKLEKLVSMLAELKNLQKYLPER